MSLKGFYKADIVSCSPDHLVTEAAQMMRDRHVGNIVVVRNEGDRAIPIGLLTDRDIVVGCVATAADRINDLSVEEVMTRNPVCASEDMSVHEVIRLMQQNGVTRLPLVDASGSLNGIITSKRILAFLNEELTGIVSIADARREAGQLTHPKGNQPSSSSRRAGAPSSQQQQTSNPS